MTYNVKMMIKNETEKDNTVAATIAKLMGYKDRNTLYKFLNDPERSCLKFAGLIAVVKEYFGDIEFNVMTDYAKSLTTYSKETARCLLEYANLNRLDELQAYLIEKMSSPKNSSVENRDWAKIYQLDIDVQNGKENILSSLDSFSSRFQEVVAFKNILKMYCYYDEQHSTMMRAHSGLAESSINNIEVSNKSDEYIKNSYTIRLSLLMMESYTSNREYLKCRKLAESVLQKDPSTNVKILALLQLGNSFITENYEQAMKHLKESLELIMFTKNNSSYESEIKRSINFLNVYWNKQITFITDANNATDKHNTIHNLINKNELDKAMNLLNQIDYNSLNSVDKGFHKYYEGILLDNKNAIYESIMNFKITGNKNFCDIPLSKLREQGENEMQLNLYVS